MPLSISTFLGALWGPITGWPLLGRAALVLAIAFLIGWPVLLQLLHKLRGCLYYFISFLIHGGFLFYSRIFYSLCMQRASHERRAELTGRRNRFAEHCKAHSDACQKKGSAVLRTWCRWHPFRIIVCYAAVVLLIALPQLLSPFIGKEYRPYVSVVSNIYQDLEYPMLKHSRRAPSLVETPITHYQDVSPDDWYYSAVSFVYRHNIMRGQSQNFSPNERLTKSTYAFMMYQLAGSPRVSERISFENSGDFLWCWDAVSWAVENGLFSMPEDGHFQFDAFVTKEEFAFVLYRDAIREGCHCTFQDNPLSSFPDSENTAEWAVEAVKWSVYSGILSGDSDGNLYPGKQVSRGESAVLIMRYCEWMETEFKPS